MAANRPCADQGVCRQTTRELGPLIRGGVHWIPASFKLVKIHSCPNPAGAQQDGGRESGHSWQVSWVHEVAAAALGFAGLLG